MTEYDIIYCYVCGSKLIEKTEPTKRYDVHTGKLIYITYKVCPNYKEFLGVGNVHYNEGKRNYDRY